MAQRIELPVRKFIERKLKENFPELDFRRSTALNDAVANPFALLIQPFRHEIDGIKIAQSLRYYNYLTEAQVDDLLFNLLVFRKQGDKSYGTVRINFFVLGDYQYDTLTFVTSDGLRYYNSSAISVAPGDLKRDEDDTYYVDIAAESENNGAEYSISNGSIVGISEDIPEIARVTNPFSFTQASSKETNFDLFKRAQDAVITRTLLNEYAIKTVLFNEFAFLTDLNVVGAGNPAMLRDIVTIDGRSIHTYGKVDVYINTNSVQEDDVDISYVPEDLTIDIVANTTTETVFPTDGNTASSGNCRNLYFADSLNDFGTRSYFNNILRVYVDKFNETVFTDFVIKSRTPQQELVVVETKNAEGAQLIAHDGGYISVDIKSNVNSSDFFGYDFTSDLKDQYLFSGQNGQGSNYSKVSVNGANSVFLKKTPSVFVNTMGAEGSADSRILNLNGISISAISWSLNPTFVVTSGDATGRYDMVLEVLNPLSSTVSVLGQEKYSEIGGVDLQNCFDSYTFTGDSERCISINDHIVLRDSNGYYHTSTITAVDPVNFAYVNYVTITESIPAGFGSISIRDGLHGNLSESDRCYIFHDDSYQTKTSYFSMPGATRIVYGPAGSTITYIKWTSPIALSIGDWIENGNTLGPVFEVISVPSSDAFIVRGLYTISGGVNIYKNKQTTSFSPVISGGPFTLYASGIYNTSINATTVTSATNTAFIHPNIAVGAITYTFSSDRLHLVNYTKMSKYQSAPVVLSNTHGINGLIFSNATLTDSPTFTDGDFWAIVKSNTSLPAGGSCWGDVFSWYNTVDLDSTLLGFEYPNTNPMMKLVIAGGPNVGIYNVTELISPSMVRLDTELGEVSTIAVAQTIFTGSYNSGTKDITETASLVVIEVGNTLKVKTGLAEGFYRIIGKSTLGFTISPTLTGTVFANIDAYEVVKDTYQPFFFIGDESRFPNQTITQGFEVWTPMEPIRRMAEGVRGDVSGTVLTDNNVNFKLQFADLPIAGTTLTILNGTNIDEQRTMVAFNDGNPHVSSYSASLVSQASTKWEMARTVQNLYQQSYQIIDNHDYYQDKLFVLPTLFIRSINEIDPITNATIGDPLIPNYDYFMYCRDSEAATLRYSANEKNIIKFREAWKSKGMRITYLGDPNITLIDQFVSTDVMRTTNNDMLVKRMESTIVDVYCQVKGVDQADATTAIEQYITTKSSKDPVQASDIISVLYGLGANYINTETFLFKSYYMPPVISGDMWQYNSGSRDEILTPAHSTYIPGIVNVEVLDA